jgi:dihydroorotate dehydrogenase
MYSFIRFILFLFSPEKAHKISVTLIKIILRIPLLRLLLAKEVVHEKLAVNLFGLTFKNPVGLAAGFDKDAQFFNEMGALGFGFVEVGTVTPLPQEGNPKPRLFRLKSDAAIINRMGFNNEGVTAVAKRLAKRKMSDNLIIGGNIGKNKWTPNEKANDDYIKVFKELYPYVDYFAVNVSSPNTENLRALQDKEPLMKLLGELKRLNIELQRPKPILLKIAPDLSNDQLDDIVEIALSLPLDGIIATNTTISRQGLITSPEVVSEIGAGGLSGKPLTKRSTEVIRYLNQKLGGSIPIIGVGGIHSTEDALEKLAAGASLIQLYTGFIYEGASLIADINNELIKRG